MSGRLAAAVLTAILISSALTGCVTTSDLLRTSAASSDGDAPGAAPASGVMRMESAGKFPVEPHLAVRGTGATARIVVGDFVDMPHDAPDQASRFHIEIHRSVDGGRSWTSAPLPRSVFAPFDPLDRIVNSGDAVLAYGPSGELYLGGVATDGVAVQGVHSSRPGEDSEPILAFNFHVFVTRSDDDGATWSPALFWAEGIGVPYGVLQDKEWVTVGPDGVVHFGWTTFTMFQTHIRHVRSTDGGATWSEPTTIAEVPHPGDDAVQSVILSAPGDGRVYATYSLVDQLREGPFQDTDVQMVRASADNGVTFGPAVAVGPATPFRFGHVAADPNDPLHAVVTGSTTESPWRVYASETTDGGFTWSAPLHLAPGRSGDQLLPTAWFDKDGRALVAYYDEGWPGGERVVVTVLEDGAVVDEFAAPGGPIDPGFHRREYLGFSGERDAVWAAWVGGDESTGTFIEVARFGL